MDRRFQVCAADRFPAMPPASNYEGEHIGYGMKVEADEASAMMGEPEKDQPMTHAEVMKLRTFFLEKLTVKQLLHLVSTLDESNGNGPLVKNTFGFKERLPRLKRRERIGKTVRPSKVYRSTLVPKDIRYAFSTLSISNFMIETPVTSNRTVNCIKVCAGTSRLLYDTNFLLGDDWCSCVISVHFDQIEAITCSRLELNLDLKQPAIVEAGYRNGISTILAEANIEIEHGLRHQLVMRSHSDMVGFKAALVATDPTMVHKFMVAKFNSDPDMEPMQDQPEPYPAVSDVTAPYLQHVDDNMLASDGTSHYMVPQLCPTSYGQISGDNLFCQNPGYAPSVHYDGTHFTQGLPGFQYPAEPGTNYRQISAKLEPIDSFETSEEVDAANSTYTHEGLFHESQYANTLPASSPVGEYYVQDMQTNSRYYAESTATWTENPSTTTVAQHHLDESCPPPRKSILEMALLGIGDTNYLEHGTHEGGHLPWAGDASHLGYFDTPSA